MSWMGNSQSGSRSGPETAIDVRSQPVKSHQACSVEAGLGQPSQHVWVSIKEAGGQVQAQLLHNWSLLVLRHLGLEAAPEGEESRATFPTLPHSGSRL